ncbi:hypothetical protein [Protofrankia sp. BMG5.30]|uniref:hypothetical protein n=1 Tax=Protofrankia TaxID=2994361 RepID=UPI0011156E0A
MTSGSDCDPPRSNHGCTSSEARADVASGDYAVTIRPADRPTDVMRAWASLPDEVGFAEAFGDVEVTLVFRYVDELVPPQEPNGWPPTPG